MRSLAVAAIAALLVIGVLPAQAGEWQAKRKGDVCFATLTPTASRNAPPDRGQVYVAIRNDRKERTFDALTFAAGYPNVSKAVPTVTIGDKTFDLLPYKGAAFAKSGEPEQQILAAMLASATMRVIWKSADGKTIIVDDYDLAGIERAKAAIDAGCDREAVMAAAAAEAAAAAADEQRAKLPRGNPFQ